MWRHWPLVVLMISVPLQLWISKYLFPALYSVPDEFSPLPKPPTQGSSYYLQKAFASLDKKLKLQEWSRWPEKLVECAKKFLFDYIGSNEEDVEEVDVEEEEGTGTGSEASATAKKETKGRGSKKTVVISKKKSPDSEETEDVEETFDDKVHFAGSKVPRSPRHPDVDYRVGQVFRHTKHKYRGVIVGWDARPKVPVQVAKIIFRDHPERKELPFYAALIDTRDRVAPQLDYVSQDQIQIIPTITIVHPLITEYFEDRRPSAKTGMYSMRPFFREVYPED